MGRDVVEVDFTFDLMPDRHEPTAELEARATISSRDFERELHIHLTAFLVFQEPSVLHLIGERVELQFEREISKERCYKLKIRKVER